MTNENQTQEVVFSQEDIPLLVDFVAEANEHIESAEASLLDLENAPDDNELLNQIFRAFHTIKGLAGFLGLSEIGSLSHSAENLLDLARKGQLSLTGNYVDAIFESIDTLKRMISEVNEAVENNTPLAAVENTQELIEKLNHLCNTDAAPTPSETPDAQTKEIPASEQQKSDEKVTEATPTEAQDISFSQEDIPLLVDFVAEANEHIESAESSLLQLENAPDDNELLNQIFRAFHTIKGLAGFLGLSEIGSLSHSAENLLDLARKGQLSLTGNYVDAIFESIDTLKKMISEVNEAVENNTPLAAVENTQELIEKLNHLCNTDAAPTPSETPNAQTKEITVSEQQTPDEKVTETTASKDSVPESKQPSGTEKEIVTVSDKKKDSKKTASDSKSIKTKIANDKIKVSTSRLDYLVNTVGELVIAQLMLSEEIYNNTASDNDLLRKISHQGKIVRELQELSMSMRMVPISDVFQKMNRLARDLSRKAEKNIIIDIEGEETELDRTLVDKIADPLVHMVRNSVDHGIEVPADRKKNGKNETGTLFLRAFHQSGKIIIEVEDDGKGLDKDRILNKAVNSGLIEKDQDLSDEDIFKLIFHPGFSTAQKVTSVSGRGVGMDVVKKNIESLRGKVSISSTAGKGTKFTIQLPLTLAIIDGQIVKVGQERYVIPINSISYSFRPLSDQVFSVCDKGEMVMVQDQLYPLVRLYDIFDIEPQTSNPCDALIVLVEDNNQKHCLLVDELLDQQQVVIKNLGDHMDQTKGFTGGAIMGDGKVSLILDIPGLIELAKMQSVNV